MKKHFLFFILLIYTFNTNWGQSYIEIFGGYNISNYYTKNLANTETSISSYSTYLIGVNYTERQNKLINIKFGFDYLYRDFDIEIVYQGLAGSSQRELRINLHSMNLRILPNFTFGKSVKTSIYAGPYFEFIVGGHKKGTGYSIIYNDSTSENSWIEDGKVNDNFGGSIGLMIGVSIEVLLPKNLILISSVNYSKGLGSLSNNNFDGNIGKLNSRNFFITIGIAYTFNNFTLKNIFNKNTS